MKRSNFIEKKDKEEGKSIATDTPKSRSPKATPRFTAISYNREHHVVFDAAHGEEIFEAEVRKEADLYAAWHNEHPNE